MTKDLSLPHIETPPVVDEQSAFGGQIEARERRQNALNTVLGELVVSETTDTLLVPPTQTEVVDTIAEQGYYKKAPKLYELLAIPEDDPRWGSISYGRKGVRTMGEHQALDELRRFLVQSASDITSFRRGYIAPKTKDSRGPIPGANETALVDQEDISDEEMNGVLADYSTEADIALDMSENMTYIAEKEFNEAVQGIGELWKDTLTKNPDLQLVVDASTKELQRYKNKPGEKSDTYIRDRVLASFSDEELDKFGGRIVSSLDEVTVNPEDVKVIILDDWSMSGDTISSRYNDNLLEKAEKLGIGLDQFETHLLCAREDQIEEGIKVRDSVLGDDYMSVKSFFLAHKSTAPLNIKYNQHGAYISGSHSAVNHNFYVAFRLMLLKAHNASSKSKKVSSKIDNKQITIRPAVANIESKSKQPVYEIDMSGKFVRRKG